MFLYTTFGQVRTHPTLPDGGSQTVGKEEDENSNAFIGRSWQPTEYRSGFFIRKGSLPRTLRKNLRIITLRRAVRPLSKPCLFAHGIDRGVRAPPPSGQQQSCDSGGAIEAILGQKHHTLVSGRNLSLHGCCELGGGVNTYCLILGEGTIFLSLLPVCLLSAETHARPPQSPVCHGAWDGRAGPRGSSAEAPATPEETDRPGEARWEARGGPCPHLANEEGPLREERCAAGQKRLGKPTLENK